ncbi:translation initiation factor IF-1 [Candidatus Beckwithbacteria bacterium CG10_big_fil_rev_8_21_14_0_10_34_10]|uniref:Translation initiation factor IF-1 n=1 Tax=Candidatus Beckwithbacteria bacterium CG10_big_fil_rev_8_21_14_0_10_34_10 TaxID=1974495 RepID=A0A2H0W9Y9_9BACT|nr:MAG: translation initiation factor IF-1 [Candidatus Beckwithbacteria bacterium CG10_big_fil_rev_8_21_14_0_10_34_10]
MNKKNLDNRDKKVEKDVIEGEITEALPNAMFRVKISDGRILLCTLSGKMRIHRIRVMPGDQVKLETTPYDETKGRIVYRLK